MKKELDIFVKDRAEILYLLDRDYPTYPPKFKEYDILTKQYRKDTYGDTHYLINQKDEIRFGYKALEDLIDKYVKIK